MAVCLLHGHGGDQFRYIACARQPDAQISILGHVVRVPSAHFVEHVAADEKRRAPQWQDKPHPCRARQDQAPPRRVFNGETARQPVLAGIVVVENALQNSSAWPGLGKTGHHLFQLIRLGRILGIPDADNRPLTKVERIVQCPRLGGDRTVIRHLDHAHPMGQGGARYGLASDRVLGLQHQNNLKQRLGIGEPRQSFDQHVRNVFLAIKRDQHRHLGHARQGHRRQRCHLRGYTLCQLRQQPARLEACRENQGQHGDANQHRDKEGRREDQSDHEHADHRKCRCRPYGVRQCPCARTDLVRQACQRAVGQFGTVKRRDLCNDLCAVGNHGHHARCVRTQCLAQRL